MKVAPRPGSGQPTSYRLSDRWRNLSGFELATQPEWPDMWAPARMIVAAMWVHVSVNPRVVWTAESLADWCRLPEDRIGPVLDWLVEKTILEVAQ